MKKFAAIPFAAAALSLCIVGGTNIYLSALPRSAVTALTRVDYRRSVSVTGEIVKRGSKLIKTDMPLVVDEVLISPGENISAGDTVLTVRREETAAKIMQYSKYESLGFFDPSITDYDSLVEAVPQKVVSTYSGTVLGVSASSGGFAAKDSVIATLIGENDLMVSVNISEKLASDVRIGQNAEIMGSGFDGRVYKGVVEDISAVASKEYVGTAQETVVPVKIRICDADSSIKPGFSADVTIFTAQAETVCVLPYEAIDCEDVGNENGNGGEYVYVLSDGIAVKREIGTGRELSEGIEVVSGIDMNEHVLLNRTEIKENSPVRIEDGEDS